MKKLYLNRKNMKKQLVKIDLSQIDKEKGILWDLFMLSQKIKMKNVLM